MSLITYHELCLLVSTGVISPVDADQINAASIDVRLGHTILKESDPMYSKPVIDLAKKQSPEYEELDISESGYTLHPRRFCLAHTLETFALPNDIAAEFRLKSSIARAGLNQSLAVWCDPGWHGSVLTLELSNVLHWNSLHLTAGMKIGQMVFYRGAAVPDHASYAVRGQYNNDVTATAPKGYVGKRPIFMEKTEVVK